MKICVTGGAGFIGSNFARNLIRGQFPEVSCSQLFVIDKLTYAGNLENLSPILNDSRVKFIRGDICDTQLLDDVFSKVDVVINFAAESHVDRSINDVTPFVQSNVLGAVRVMESCVRNNVRKLIQVGTDEVYGSLEVGQSSEIDKLTCNSPYSASKGAADLFAGAFHKTFGLDVVVTRSSNNYGPYQYPEKLIPLFVTNLLLGLQVPIYGDGSNIREWIHIDDNCRAIAMLVNESRAGETVNIGSGVFLTNLEVAKLLIEMLDASMDCIRFIEDRRGHDFRYALDSAKITRYGFQPKVAFEDGLLSTVNWYRENKSWWESIRANSHEKFMF